MPQDGHNTQAQAGGVTAHQVRGLEQQLGLHHAQLVQQLSSHPGSAGGGRGLGKMQINSQPPAPLGVARLKGRVWGNVVLGGSQDEATRSCCSPRHPSHQVWLRHLTLLSWEGRELLHFTAKELESASYVVCIFLAHTACSWVLFMPFCAWGFKGPLVRISAWHRASNMTWQPISATGKLGSSAQPNPSSGDSPGWQSR